MIQNREKFPFKGITDKQFLTGLLPMLKIIEFSILLIGIFEKLLFTELVTVAVSINGIHKPIPCLLTADTPVSS